MVAGGEAGEVLCIFPECEDNMGRAEIEGNGKGGTGNKSKQQVTST